MPTHKPLYMTHDNAAPAAPKLVPSLSREGLPTGAVPATSDPRMRIYWLSYYTRGFRIYTRHYSQSGVDLRLRELAANHADMDTVRIEEKEDPPWKA